MEGISDELARFVHATRLSDLPESALHAARRAVVNIIGCCLGGARHEIVEASARALLPYSGSGVATILGRQERADILTAALLNCLSSAAYSFDDTHADAILHPSGAVATSLLALSEQHPITGGDFLLAFVLGVDVACRISKAVSVAPAIGDIGWSQTGVVAGIGAAVATAKALKLDAERIKWALGIAALQASGFRNAHGTMSATLIFGHAAHTGLRAALLAKDGLTGPAAPLEGKFGFLSLFASKPNPDALNAGLGNQFEVEHLAYKPYPCGVVIHPAVDAALTWHRSSATPKPEQISEVVLQAHPSAGTLGFRRHPVNELEAKVSLFHWIAVALTFGKAGLSEGTLAVVEHPTVHRLREAVQLVADESLDPDSAVMTVTTRDGNERKIAIDHCIGSVANPMSDANLSDKFMQQALTAMSKDGASELLKATWKIDGLEDLSSLTALKGELVGQTVAA